jgi:hypothetical protein
MGDDGDDRRTRRMTLRRSTAPASPMNANKPGYFDTDAAWRIIWAPERRLTLAEKGALSALVSRARFSPGDPAMPVGECDPGQGHVGACASMHGDHAGAILRRLEGTWVDIIRRKGASCRYRLTFDRGVASERAAEPSEPGSAPSEPRSDLHSDQGPSRARPPPDPAPDPSEPRSAPSEPGSDKPQEAQKAQKRPQCESAGTHTEDQGAASEGERTLSPDAAAILNALRASPTLTPVARPALAKGWAEELVTPERPIGSVLRAIETAGRHATDAARAGQPWPESKLPTKIRTYIERERGPDENPLGGRSPSMRRDGERMPRILQRWSGKKIEEHGPDEKVSTAQHDRAPQPLSGHPLGDGGADAPPGAATPPPRDWEPALRALISGVGEGGGRKM